METNSSLPTIKTFVFMDLRICKNVCKQAPNLKISIFILCEAENTFRPLIIHCQAAVNGSIDCTLVAYLQLIQVKINLFISHSFSSVLSLIRDPRGG